MTASRTAPGLSAQLRPRASDGSGPRIVVLSSSLLTERMLRHSSFGAIELAGATVEIWSTAAAVAEPDHPPMWANCHTREFPEVGPLPYLPHGFMRRFNDHVWDAHIRSPSRETMHREVRRKRLPVEQRISLPLARIAARVGLAPAIERIARRIVAGHERSPEATARLRAFQPDLLVTTGPHRYEEPAVVASAQRLGIPVLALITSWDNLTTKSRMLSHHSGYLVWTEHMRAELLAAYSEVLPAAVRTVGAPQFDAFFDPRAQRSRTEHWRALGLDPTRPVVLYALGSPNFIREHFGALDFARRVQQGELGNIQLLVRPHPLFDNGAEASALADCGPDVHVQRTGRAGVPVAGRAQTDTDVVDWVNTFRHADVVVNLSSTATVDAAICGRPVVNLDFDPEPGQPNASLIRDVNHVWPHFRPVAESGGVWLAASMGDVVSGVRAYLANPELHAEQRQWIVAHVAGVVDGQAGARLARAIVESAVASRAARVFA